MRAAVQHKPQSSASRGASPSVSSTFLQWHSSDRKKIRNFYRLKTSDTLSVSVYRLSHTKL